jgi:two-component system osmolarity sensor histidine kinase EnvZ
MPRSLFARAVILIIAPMALLQAVLVYIFLERHVEDITRRFAGGIAGEIALLADAYQHVDERADFEQINAMVGYHLGLIATIEPKRPLPAPSLIGPLSVVRRQMTNDLAERLGRTPLVYNSDDPTYLEVFVELDNAVLHVFAPRARMRTATTDLLLYWTIGLTVVLVSVAIIFLRNQIKPIVRLTIAAENFGRGVDDETYRPGGATEIRRAGAAFIEMRERIRRYIDQRTTMLAAISHDLRTPMTRLKLGLAMLRPSEEIEDLKSDVIEMEHMVAEYLAFAQDQTSEAAESHELGPLLVDVVQTASRFGPPVALAERAQHSSGLTARFRANAIRRCLNNLIENACRFGTEVRVDAERCGSMIEIRIEDNGPGIAPGDVEAALTPFVRLDPARNPNRAGVGLGLAIARDIARGHGGDLILGRSDLGGLKAVVSLPALES